MQLPLLLAQGNTLSLDAAVCRVAVSKNPGNTRTGYMFRYLHLYCASTLLYEMQQLSLAAIYLHIGSIPACASGRRIHCSTWAALVLGSQPFLDPRASTAQ